MRRRRRVAPRQPWARAVSAIVPPALWITSLTFYAVEVFRIGLTF